MRRAGAVALMVLVAIAVLLPTALADETLPPEIGVVAIDEYVEEIPVGGNASFAWSLVNQGVARVNLTVVGNISSPDYGLTVSPGSSSLDPSGVLIVYANVTVPTEPRSSRANIEVVVRLDTGNHTHLRATVIAREATRLVDLITAFLATGAIIFIGFFAALVFERTKVPDLIFLIILGVVLGPVLATFFSTTLVPLSLLKLVTPYFAALALMIILFDGGLGLDIGQVVRRAGVSIVHTLIAWIGSVFVVTFVTMLFLGYPFWVGVLLGVVVGGTSGAVVIGVVRGMSIQEDTKTILVLESTITDVLCVIGAITVIGILRGGGTLTGTIGGLLGAFSIALLLGLVTGVLWLRALNHMVGRPFGFMITIAALFVLYAGTELLGGSGAMAALMFGLVLGNHKAIGRVLRIKEAFHIDEHFKQFESEISFVVRTFFFVFLGFSFTFPFATAWAVRTEIPGLSYLNGTFWLIIAAIILIFLGIYGARVLATGATTRLHPEVGEDRRALKVVMGRGLAAAVLASLPFAIPAFTDPANPDYAVYRNGMAAYENQFLTIAFVIILLTVIATTVGVVSAERSRRPAGFAEAATDSLGRAMQVQNRETRKELDRKEREDRRRRERELKRIEKELRRRRKRR